MNNKTKFQKIRPTIFSNFGFTLIELMVVITIVAIMFSFLALSFRGDSPKEAIKTEALRLNQLIQVALEQAIIHGDEYAIIFKPSSYEFAKLENNEWKPISNDRILRLRELPEDITMELTIEKSTVSFLSNSDNEDSKSAKPQVFLLSSGEITPEFSINMATFGVNTVYTIVGEANGQHSANSSAY